MGRTKLPIIACVILMLFISGILIFHKAASDKDSPIYTEHGKAAASSVLPGTNTSTNNSGNYTYIPPTYEYDDSDDNKEEDQMSDSNSAKTPWTPATEMDLDPSSITVYVNKEYSLPKDYVPENMIVPNIPFDTSGYAERKLMRKEAAEAIERLFAAAKKAGYTLYGISGYRSYERQKDIFVSNILKKGKEHTLKYSAAPGTSEHQTGLAMDVSAKSVRYKLITAFAYSEEGKWLAEHAHEYGYIIRYPKDRSETTGYAYEPWHIRYVGEELANYLYTNNLTLDEYYNYVPSKDFDYEKKYADLINYKPAFTPTPLPDSEDELDDDLLEDLPEDILEDLPDEIPDEDLDDITTDHEWDEDYDEEGYDLDEDYIPDPVSTPTPDPLTPTPTTIPSYPAPTSIPSSNTEEEIPSINDVPPIPEGSVPDVIN